MWLSPMDGSYPGMVCPSRMMPLSSRLSIACCASLSHGAVYLGSMLPPRHVSRQSLTTWHSSSSISSKPRSTACQTNRPLWTPPKSDPPKWTPPEADHGPSIVDTPQWRVPQCVGGPDQFAAPRSVLPTNHEGGCPRQPLVNHQQAALPTSPARLDPTKPPG